MDRQLAVYIIDMIASCQERSNVASRDCVRSTSQAPWRRSIGIPAMATTWWHCWTHFPMEASIPEKKLDLSKISWWLPGFILFGFAFVKFLLGQSEGHSALLNTHTYTFRHQYTHMHFYSMETRPTHRCYFGGVTYLAGSSMFSIWSFPWKNEEVRMQPAHTCRAGENTINKLVAISLSLWKSQGKSLFVLFSII